MTLDELDSALTVLGLDLQSNDGKSTKDRILAEYGRTIVESSKDACGKCDVVDKSKCGKCRHNYILKFKSAIDVAKCYLGNVNDVNLMSFVVMYVIPIYERDTGRTGTMDLIANELKKVLKKRRVLTEKV